MILTDVISNIVTRLGESIIQWIIDTLRNFLLGLT